MVDLFQPGLGTREQIRQREIREWKENYYLGDIIKDLRPELTNPDNKKDQIKQKKRRNS